MNLAWLRVQPRILANMHKAQSFMRYFPRHKSERLYDGAVCPTWDDMM